MREINHDPGEDARPKVPDYGERKWARDKFGGEPKPSDLLRFILPIAAVAVAMYLWRGY